MCTWMLHEAEAIHLDGNAEQKLTICPTEEKEDTFPALHVMCRNIHNNVREYLQTLCIILYVNITVNERTEIN